MPTIRGLWHKRKSIVFTWLISYSAVLFVPIAISLVIYSQASHALKGEIHRANDALLKQMRYTIDNQVDLMKRLDMEITWNDKLQSLMYSSKPAKEAPFTAYQLAKEFRLYKTSYASIDEFYVVWDQGGAILRPGNIRDLRTAFRTLHDTGDLSYDDWSETVRGPAANRFAVLPHLGAGTSDDAIAYITRLPDDLSGNPTGSIVVMADASRFRKAIEGISDFGEGLLLILDKDNDILLSSRPDAPELQPFLEGGHVRLTQARIGDSELFYMPSAVSDLKYALIFPSAVYWKKAEYVRSFASISILLSLIGAGILTWFFTRRNYTPIHELMQSLTDRNAPTERGDGNELRYIQRAVLNARSEKERIATQLQKHQQTLRSNMIYRLLKGKLDARVPYEEAFRTFHMALPSNEFAVLLFVLENEESLYAKLPGIDLNERARLAPFIIGNVVEELALQRQHAGYVAEADDMLACLVCLKPDAPDVRGELTAIASEAQAFLRRYDMELTISVSGCHSAWAGIAAAYQEAVDAMEYKMVLGKQGILAYEDICANPADSSGSGYYYPLQAEQQLINFIKAGDFGQASSYMREITERNFGGRVMPLALARCLLFDLVGTMVKAIGELGEGSAWERDAGWMDAVIASGTLQEMQEALQTLLRDVCAFAAEKRASNAALEREGSLRELTAEVVRYIEAHYTDANLNVNAIGERFDLKGSYLSRLFKNQTGEGLLDCIHKTRIARAKAMFRAKQESINDISRLVGYNDAATFIRVFKKYEGITPGKYKEIV
ncbi:Helix-turn-helix domain-containing protein [Paenibacillus sp. UNC496MF]|uniref:helix-turn-helix domain-containing protein n=1 Tax=Paenibacillus sp. UNC496MF TaxID=1502753 RepID=UPI0008DF5D55|nr:helix-turn-helix domain-containing protein [Paenibacillus sp. UNC496MF]SFI39449.1 Helix-turn-helix domain-containing protein [Paenibacillus sp. UNC496MF]